MFAHFDVKPSDMRAFAIASVLLFLPHAHAQFVYPKPEYNQSVAGTYQEDPFIVTYRRKFFAVFRGDFKTFETAYAEINTMLEKNPKDARALVWLGNGQTVKAGLLRVQGKQAEAEALLETSRETLDSAVKLKPKDPNIYMMRAATLYIQGQYWPADKLPRRVWETLRDDCNTFIKFIGPTRMPKVSTHVRGEAYGELGIAYKNLGDTKKAVETFKKLIQLNPDTDYAKRAEDELRKLKIS